MLDDKNLFFYIRLNVVKSFNFFFGFLFSKIVLIIFSIFIFETTYAKSCKELLVIKPAPRTDLVSRLVNIKLPTLEETQPVVDKHSRQGQFSLSYCNKCGTFDGLVKFLKEFNRRVELLLDDDGKLTDDKRKKVLLEITSLLSNPLLQDKDYLKLQVTRNIAFNITLGTVINEAWFKFVESANYKAMDAFLSSPIIDVNIGDRRKYTNSALHYAAANGKIGLLRYLLRQPGIDINAGGSGGDSAIEVGTKAGQAKAVKILANTPGIVLRASYLGSALQIASENGNVEIIKILLDAGADVNEQTLVNYSSPLIGAAYNRHLDAVVELLKAPGVLVNYSAKGGVTLNVNESGTALIAAAYNGGEKILKKFIADKRIDILTENAQGETALSLTAAQGSKSFPLLLNALTKRGLRLSDEALEVLLYRLFIDSFDHRGKVDGPVWKSLVKNNYVTNKEGASSFSQQIMLQDSFNINVEHDRINQEHWKKPMSPVELVLRNGTPEDMAFILKDERLLDEGIIAGALAVIGESVRSQSAKVRENLSVFLQHPLVITNLPAMVKAAVEDSDNESLKVFFSMEPLPSQVLQGLFEVRVIDIPFLKLNLSDAALMRISPRSYLKLNKIRLNQFDTASDFQTNLKEMGVLEKAVDLMFDLVQREEVGLYLLGEASLHPNLAMVEDSADLLVWSTRGNFSAEQLRKLSVTTRSDFYSIIIQFSKNNLLSEDSWQLFSEELYENANIKEFMDFLVLIDAIYKIENHDQDELLSIEQIILQINSGVEVSADSLKDYLSKGRERLLNKVNDILSIKGQPFDFETYENLESRWGDLNPIWVLVARLRGLTGGSRRDFDEIIPVMREIFLYSLEDRFSEYKFSGVTDEQKAEVDRQLSMLNAEGRDEWSEPKVIVRRGEGQMSPEEMWLAQQESIRSTIETNVIPNWNQVLASIRTGEDTSEDLSSTDWSKAILDFEGALNEFASANQLENTMDQVEVLNLSLESMKDYLDHPQDLKKIVSAFKLMLFNILKDNQEDKALLNQVISDLKDIESRLNSEQVASSENLLIASVKTSDPRMLMIIGDAVKGCSSCQSYSTGGMIYTLPGYVIDANVQALLSYALKTSDFKSEDFLKVNAWVDGDAEVNITFDGNLRVFRFEKDGEVIETYSLESAFLRNIVKLGHLESSPDTPALFLERDYSQTHNFLSQMQSQHSELLEDLAKSIEAELSGVITVPASRSPSGHYSDARGGSRLEDYTVEIDR